MNAAAIAAAPFPFQSLGMRADRALTKSGPPDPPDGPTLGARTRRMANAARAETQFDASGLAGKAVRAAPILGDVALYLLLIVLTWAAWRVSRMEFLVANSDARYWIGVAGGSLMVALFAYPLRKHLRVLHSVGRVKWWFWLHMTLGIVGPLLVLVHSRFRVASLNSAVALYSMLIVVASGIVGRFIYVRVHRGLDGERTSLQELRERAGFVERDARSALHFSPSVEARLLAFERRELRAEASWANHLRQVTVLPMQRWIAHVRCMVDLRRSLHALADEHRWGAAELRRRRRSARRMIDRYLHAVVRVAQYTAYERVFALWHVAHLPFVALLVISAVVHVYAVHAY
jgi:hypothetical protein